LAQVMPAGSSGGAICACTARMKVATSWKQGVTPESCGW